MGRRRPVHRVARLLSAFCFFLSGCLTGTRYPFDVPEGAEATRIVQLLLQEAERAQEEGDVRAYMALWHSRSPRRKRAYHDFLQDQKFYEETDIAFHDVQVTEKARSLEAEWTATFKAIARYHRERKSRMRNTFVLRPHEGRMLIYNIVPKVLGSEQREGETPAGVQPDDLGEADRALWRLVERFHEAMAKHDQEGVHRLLHPRSPLSPYRFDDRFVERLGNVWGVEVLREGEEAYLYAAVEMEIQDRLPVKADSESRMKATLRREGRSGGWRLYDLRIEPLEGA